MTSTKRPTSERATRPAQPRLSAATLMAIVLGLLAPASLAQPGDQGDMAPGGGYGSTEREEQQQAGPQAEYASETIDAYVKVLGELHEIGEGYADQIQQAQDAETAQQLQQEAQQEMIERVNASDIDVQTYNEISMRMNRDPEFARMVVSRAQQ